MGTKSVGTACIVTTVNEKDELSIISNATQKAELKVIPEIEDTVKFTTASKAGRNEKTEPSYYIDSELMSLIEAQARGEAVTIMTPNLELLVELYKKGKLELEPAQIRDDSER